MSGQQAAAPQSPVEAQGSMVSGPRRRSLGLVQKCGVAGLMGLILLSFIWLRQVGHSVSAKPQQAEAQVEVGQHMRPAPATTAAAAPPSTTLPMPQTTQAAHSFIGYQPQQQTASNSPILAYSGSANIAAPIVKAATDLASPATGGTAAIAEPTPLAARLKPTVVQPTKAALLPHPDFLITEGTIIPCTLQTAIDSELAGYVKCVIPQDVRGTTGNVVLLDKGTVVVGEVQQGLVQGQHRLFVLWDRAETPDHAVITLDAPGSDALGRAGLPGAVDTHFWQRFGSAILLSVIQGGLQAGTALAANSGSGGSSNSLFLNSFQNNGSQLSNTALQASINIPPTLLKNQGDNVAIFVNRDLDFSDVYSLRVDADGE